MIYIVLVIHFLFTGFNDRYYVAAVKGNVTHKESGRPVKIGDQLSLQSTLQFKTIQDQVSLISPTKGRFIVKLNPTAKLKEHHPLVAMISEAMLPVNTTHTLATRNHVNSTNQLRLFLTQEAKIQQQHPPHFLLIDSTRVYLEGPDFKKDTEKFFFIKYQYAGEVIHKKLTYVFDEQNATLAFLIDRQIFIVDKKPIDPNSIESCALYYYDDREKESEFIFPLKIVLADVFLLRQQATLVYHHLIPYYHNDPIRAEEETCRMLAEEYGYIDRRDVHRLLH